ncbi:hypothetical protein O3M35_006158 [Rhynocoris fuscipes]|uniref:Uncharacterized protein n=1 Tax=Rhynocoris fuscipes TaxID=488301 RepID=A0AAW1DI70_9HEMI
MRRLYQNFNYCRCNTTRGTTSRCAQIITTFQVNWTKSVANTTAQSCEFCVHHISKTAAERLIFFFFFFCIPT